jgi:hypothetical protein
MQVKIEVKKKGEQFVITATPENGTPVNMLSELVFAYPHPKHPDKLQISALWSQPTVNAGAEVKVLRQNGEDNYAQIFYFSLPKEPMPKEFFRELLLNIDEI